MRLFPREPDVGETEGFAPEKDIFGRIEQGRALEHLVGSVDDPLVVALDAPWGSGKTVFLKMWAGHLRGKGYPVVYYDAFKDDYTQDAFLALAGELAILGRQRLGQSSPDVSRYLQAAKRVGGAIAKRGVGLALRIGTAGVFNLADFDGVAEEAAAIVADEAEEAFGGLLDAYFEQKSVREQFGNALANLADHLKAAEASRPLVSIVDELDRCSPTFALQVLENIKHFFSVDNVHFILGCNLTQLEHSVSAAYGSGIDARTYLEKFIHVRFRLSARSIPGQDDRRSYVERLSTLHDSPKGQLGHDLFGEIARIASAREFSFRQIERICTYAILSLTSTRKNQFNLAPVTAGLVVMRVVAPEKFDMAVSGRLSYDDVRPELAIGQHFGLDETLVDRYEKLWKFVCGDHLDVDVEREYRQLLSGSHFRNRRDMISYLSRSVADAFTVFAPDV